MTNTMYYEYSLICVSIYIYIYIHMVAHQKSCICLVSGIFRRHIIVHWHGPKDCHFSNGFPREVPTDFQWHVPMEFSFCDFLFLRRELPFWGAWPLADFMYSYVCIYIYIYIYICIEREGYINIHLHLHLHLHVCMNIHILIYIYIYIYSTLQTHPPSGPGLGQRRRVCNSFRPQALDLDSDDGCVIVCPECRGKRPGAPRSGSGPAS